MSVTVVQPAEVEQWCGRSQDPPRQAALVAAIAAATDWVQRVGNRRSLGKEPVAVSETLNSARAEGFCRRELWLPNHMRPIWYVEPTDVITVTENGQPLTVAMADSPTATNADVIVEMPNLDKPVKLFRYGGWFRDPLPVVVTCKCGWDPELDPYGQPAAFLPFPTDYRLLVIEVSWLMYTGADRVGKTSKSKAGTAVTIEGSLSPLALATLEHMQGV